MECKFNLNADRQCCEPSINRNIVECKYTVIEIIEINATVLIETLWNVNYIRKAAEVIQGFVLIETLWNVNGRTAAEKVTPVQY